MKLTLAAVLAVLTIAPAHAGSWAQNRTETLLKHLVAGRELDAAGHHSAACFEYQHAELILNQSYSDLKNHNPEFDFLRLMSNVKTVISAC